MDDVAALIPEWLNLTMTAVDAEDPSLNISHETLQQNKILRVIKKNLVKRFLGMCPEIAEKKDDYKKFYERFGECFKLGIFEGSTKRSTIAETDQRGGERGPHEGRAERHLLLHQREYRRDALFTAEEFDGKEPQSTAKEGLDLGDRDEKKMPEELKTELEPLRKSMREVLGDKVEKVTVSDRMIDSSGVLTSSEHGWSANTERIMEAQALRDNSMTSYMVSKKTVEVNSAHSAMMELKKKASTDKSDKTVKDLIWLLFETFLLTFRFNLDEPTQFAARILRMIKLGLSIDDDDEGPDDDDEPVSRIQEQIEEVAKVISKGRAQGVLTQMFEGECARTKDNDLLRKSHLKDILFAPGGASQIGVTSGTDASEGLDVSAQTSTGRSSEVATTNVKGRSSQTVIDRMIQDAQRCQDEDDTNKAKIESKNGLEKYCVTMRNAVVEGKPKFKLEKTLQTVEVPRVITQELVRPAGEKTSVRERVKQFEMNGGASGTSTVEVLRGIPGDRQTEDSEDEAPTKRRKQESDPDPRAPVHFSLCHDWSDLGAKSAGESAELDVNTRPEGGHEGERSSKLDDVMLEMRDVKSELLQVRELVGVLVRRERCIETKAEIAARRLDRMEQEQDEAEDGEHEASLQEALANQAKVVRLVVDKWFVDKGFGFGKTTMGEIVFIHASVVQGAEAFVVGTDAWAQVVSDHARAEGGGYRARRAWGRDAWREQRDKEKANRVAQQVRRAAALTAELAVQSEKKTAAVRPATGA